MRKYLSTTVTDIKYVNFNHHLVLPGFVDRISETPNRNNSYQLTFEACHHAFISKKSHSIMVLKQCCVCIFSW